MRPIGMWNYISVHAKSGDTERGDRMRSYQQGTAPYAFLLAQWLQYKPGQADAAKIVQKLRANDPSISEHNGKPWLYRALASRLRPPTLSALGRRPARSGPVAGMVERDQAATFCRTRLEADSTGPFADFRVQGVLDLAIQLPGPRAGRRH